MPERDDKDTGTRSIGAREWLLMYEGTSSAAAASYGIVGDTSNDDLRAIATLVQRAACDEGIAIDGEDLLSVLKLVRQAVDRSSAIPIVTSPGKPDLSLT